MLSKISGCVYIYNTVSEGTDTITSLGLIFLNPRLVFQDVLKILYTSLVNATLLCHDGSIVTDTSNRKTEEGQGKGKWVTNAKKKVYILKIIEYIRRGC